MSLIHDTKRKTNAYLGKQYLWQAIYLVWHRLGENIPNDISLHCDQLLHTTEFSIGSSVVIMARFFILLVVAFFGCVYAQPTPPVSYLNFFLDIIVHILRFCFNTSWKWEIIFLVVWNIGFDLSSESHDLRIWFHRFMRLTPFDPNHDCLCIIIIIVTERYWLHVYRWSSNDWRG